jgi:hypothetical protein
MRYHALADQVDCPAREALDLRLERGYLALAQLAGSPQLADPVAVPPERETRASESEGLRHGTSKTRASM